MFNNLHPTKAHAFVDGLGSGLIIAWFVYQFVNERIENNNFLENVRSFEQGERIGREEGRTEALAELAAIQYGVRI